MSTTPTPIGHADLLKLVPASRPRWFSGYDRVLAPILFRPFDRLGRKDGSYRYWALHAPNFLCWMRIVGGPILVTYLGYAHMTGRESLAGNLLIWTVLLMATDLLDGPLARHMGITNAKVGRIDGGTLDAIADKFLMIPLFIETALVASRFGGPPGDWYAAVAAVAVVLDAGLIYLTFLEYRGSKRIPRSTLKPRANQAGKWKLHFQLAGTGIAAFTLIGFAWLPVAAGIPIAAGLLVPALILAGFSIKGHLANYRAIKMAQQLLSPGQAAENAA
jgi:phosphatidylglycerophosphate synthase